MFGTPAVVAALILCAILLISGLAKWRAPKSTSSAILLLRLPKFLQKSWVARALPIGEALLALALLLPAPLAMWAAVDTLILMVIYWVVIARAMTFTPRPNCGCFGAIGNQQVTERTLVRNTVFVALAALWLVATTRGVSVIGALSDFSAAEWGWTLMALAAAVATYFVAANPAATPEAQPLQPITNAHAPNEDEDADELDYVRVPIPEAILLDSERTPKTLRELAWQRPQLLFFVNCYCASTYASWDRVHQWRDRLPQVDLTMVFSFAAVPQNNPEYPETEAYYDHYGLAWLALEIPGTSAAVLLCADGQLAGGPVGADEVDEFLADIEDVLRDTPVVVPGEVVPPPSAATPPGSPTGTTMISIGPDGVHQITQG